MVDRRSSFPEGSKSSNIQALASDPLPAVNSPVQHGVTSIELPGHDMREATELQAQPSSRPNAKQTEPRDGPPPADAKGATLWQRWRNEIRVFWSRQIAITVGHDDCRDHFGWSFQDLNRLRLLIVQHIANERTFLGYLRTSSAFAMLSVLISQLFRLEGQLMPNHGINTFFVLAVPVATVCIALAIVIALAAAHRFWRQQNAMARGKCQCGGWELHTVGILTLIVGLQHRSRW